MRKQYRKLLALPLCLAMVFILMAIPAFADEELSEPSVNEESIDLIEEPVEVPDDVPLDGDWCFNEESHWRADAVNQGIPAPHEFDENGVCVICDFVKPEDDEPGADSKNEEPSLSPESNLSSTPPGGGTAPKTGNESDPALWAVMLLLAAGVLSGVILPLRKPSKQ